MSIEVETVIAISVMMAVFSAVVAIGSSIILGAGFQRLRLGFEVMHKQTGFFSDAIYNLEDKMEVIGEQAGGFIRLVAVAEQDNYSTSPIVISSKKTEIHTNTSVITIGKTEALSSDTDQLLNCLLMPAPHGDVL